jgi:hypothetical protein
MKILFESSSINPNLVEDLVRLRDEFMPSAFNEHGVVLNSTMAEVVWKINSVLFKGYKGKQG